MVPASQGADAPSVITAVLWVPPPPALGFPSRGIELVNVYVAYGFRLALLVDYLAAPCIKIYNLLTSICTS